MKIGMVLYPTFGGSGVVGTELGKALAKKGHQVHFITYSQPVRLGSFHENIFYHEVSVSNYPLFDYQPYETELASKLVDVVKYENLDLLHVHYAIPHASAAFMAQQILRTQGIEIPFITTLHGTDITLVGKDPSFEPVIRFCINASNAVTTVSESLKQDTIKHFAIERPIHVIPNFIQIEETESDASVKDLRTKYARENQKLICHISNFRPVKRIEDVILIFNEIQKTVDSKLILVGDGPDRHVAEKMSRELGLINKVIFFGKVRDTNHILEFSDLFLLPSETESFGLAALEAMAAGVPVISSNTGGIPEVNLHGFSGYLSDVGNVKSMAAYAIDLLSNDEKLSLFKLQAKKRAALFSLDLILPQYENLYHEVIKKNH
jgi:N-acetyl-alpha-D-glucosaminyl L-malate synthase BshA